MPDTSGFKRDVTSSYIDKDPDAYLSYAVDWADWMPYGETIATHTWAVEPITGDTDPVTVEATAIIDNQSVAELSGGSVGRIYTVKNTITTDAGQTESRRFRIRVLERYL